MARMHKHLAISVVILGLSLAGCDDDGAPDGTDASLDGSTGRPDGTDAPPDRPGDAVSEQGPSPDANDAPETPLGSDVTADRDVASDGDATADRDATANDGDVTNDGQCTNPTASHGAACSVEGAKECGYKRFCTDVGTPGTTECTCTQGRFVCGSCPPCNIDLRNQGCGIGLVCDGVTFTRCDGSMFNVAATCNCMGPSNWVCNNDAGFYRQGGCDAGADGTNGGEAGADATDVDAQSDALVDVPNGDVQTDVPAADADANAPD